MNSSLRSIGKGIIDAIPVIATFRSNLDSKHLPGETGTGKLDYVRLLTCIISVGLITAFAMGKITLRDLKDLLGIIGN